MKVNPSQLLAKRALQIQRGAARAAVLGANDGLVSVLCIVLAAYGAGATSGSILLAGFAGLIAGAVSMAAGEWISVRAQVELFEGVIKDIHKLGATDRSELEHQLADNMVKKGQSAHSAKQAAAEVAEHDDDLTGPMRGKSWVSTHRSSARLGERLSRRLCCLRWVHSCLYYPGFSVKIRVPFGSRFVSRLLRALL